MSFNYSSFTDILGDDVDEIANSQPLSLSWNSDHGQPGVNATMLDDETRQTDQKTKPSRPLKHTGQRGDFRCLEEIDEKYRSVFSYPYFNLVQSRVIDDALYSDKSMVICAPTGSGKTVVFEMAIVQLLMELEDKNYKEDFKIIYMAPVKALCTERLTDWYSKFTSLGLLCIEVTGDTDVDFSQLKPYRIIITTPEKWDMLTRRWRDHRGLVEVVKLFLIDEVHILNDETRGPVLEAVVSRMKTIESSAQSAHRIERLQQQYRESPARQVPHCGGSPRIRFVAVSATVNNPEDVATWLGTADKPAVFYKFGDECRPVRLRRVVEGYPCAEGTSIFKFDIILNYKLWPIIQKYHHGKPTLIFCNTRKSVTLTAHTLARELSVSFTPEQRAKLHTLAASIKNKKLQSLVLSGVGCHHAGLLYEERLGIERAFRNRDLPILITTTTLAMGVNLPAHLVIVKNTQQYVNGAYQEYSMSTVLQMVGRAGRPQFDTEATAVIMTRLTDKARYQALVGGSEPLQSYLHKRLAENLNSEAALGTVADVAQCVQWLRSTFLCVRAARDPKWYLSLPPAAPTHLITKKIEELCVKAMNCLATSGLITMDEASCIESTEAGRLMSIYYLDLETMKHIMKIEGSETLERILWVVCESHELAAMHLRMEERRCLNALNRNNAAATVRFPMKGKINTRQMKLNCMIQAILGSLPIPDPSLNQEAMKIMRIALRVCKCLVAYVTRSELISKQPQVHAAVLNSLVLTKCMQAHLWENSIYVSKQLRGIGLTFSTLLATAGKLNFMLLEESHPRDLERIMNKGAPAGNVIRKQVGLLPKYQLTMTPVDEKTVSIRLKLLNQAHLAENLDQLTAGEHHRCHVIVGDSENHLLLLTSFNDKDLISVYDGTMAYEIKRKHKFEHKVVVHCVSTTFVGIDTQCEYTFNNLEPLHNRREADIIYLVQDTPIRKTAPKQTSITDVYKERKRKNNDNITQSKEKKKRDNDLIEQFKHLKESFGIGSKELKQDLHQSAEMSNKILLESFRSDKSTIKNKIKVSITGKKDDNADVTHVENYHYIPNFNEYPEMTIEDVDVDSSIVNERVDNILIDIENEISKMRDPGFSNRTTNTEHIESDAQVQRTLIEAWSKPEINKVMHMDINQQSKTQSHKPAQKETRRRKAFNTKSNYNFIDALEKKANFSDDEDHISKNYEGFSNTIKCQMKKFLQKTQKITTQPDVTLMQLIDLTTDSPNLEKDRNILIVEEMEKEIAENRSSEYPLLKEVEDKESINEKMMECEAEFKTLHESRSFEDKLAEADQDYITDRENAVDLEKERVESSNEKVYDDKMKAICNTNINPGIEHTAVKHEKYLKNIDAVLSSTMNETCKVDNETKIIVPPINLENRSLNSNVTKSDNIMEKTCGEDLKEYCKDGKPNIHEVVKFYDTNTDRKCPVVPNNKNKELIDLKSSNNDRIAVLNDYAENYMQFGGGPSVVHVLLKNSNSNKLEGPNNKKLDTNEIHIAGFGKNIDNISQKYSPPISWPYQSFISKELKPHGDSNSACENNRKILNSEIKSSGRHSSKSENTSLITTIPMLPSANNGILAQGTANILKDVNVNKYSFSATKIDVCTEITPQHQVRIIRKLKLDLDITEIVSNSNTKAYNNENENSDENCNMNVRNLDVQNLLRVEKTNLEPPKVEHYLGVQTPLSFKYNVPETIPMNIKRNQCNGELKSNKEYDEEESTVSKTERINGDRDETKPENACKETGATNVANVLEKYSTILRKNNPSVINNVDTKNLDKCNETEHTTRKSKRPYKISDIHKLNITLPKTLIVEAYRSPRPTNDTILAQIKAKHPTEENPINYRAAGNFTTPQNNYKDPDIEDIPEEIPECPTPPEITEDSNSPTDDIDQSMFDPKTFLQYCNEIIPPPLKFSDRESAVYSPMQDINMDELTTQENNYEYSPETVNEVIENRTSEKGHDTSMFEEYPPHNTLTPSKEIETWTLSRDASWEKSEFSSTPIKSFTVMRKNSPKNDTKAKLGHFKFTRKQKLRI